MKKTFIFVLILGIISLSFMILSFLALNDISHDYFSIKILSSKDVDISINKLPEWTQCKCEWLILQIDFILRIIFMITFIVFIIKLIKNNK